MSDVRDNPAEHRFELRVDGQLAVATYRREGDILVLEHTGVPEALEGHGVGSRLIEGALAAVRARGLKVEPACPFVAAYIERHPESQDLLSR